MCKDDLSLELGLIIPNSAHQKKFSIEKVYYETCKKELCLGVVGSLMIKQSHFWVSYMESLP